jgi:hypothetical protein
MKNVYVLENVTHLPDVSVLAAMPIELNGLRYMPSVPELREEGLIRYTPELHGLLASNPFFNEMTVRELPEGLGGRYGVTARQTKAARVYTLLLIVIMAAFEIGLAWIATNRWQQPFSFTMMMPVSFFLMLFAGLTVTKRSQRKAFARQFEAKIKELS